MEHIDSTGKDAPAPGRTPSRWHALSLQRRALAKGVLAALALVAVLAWVLAPGVRAVTLIGNWAGRSTPDPTRAGLPVESVRFAAVDGVRLAGWLVIASANAPTVILAHGFKSSRLAMLPWAQFLHAAGYNALLFDERGCGQSDGWAIGLGASEPNDVIGAVRYLMARADLTNKRFAALGVSLGAGAVLLAAAREPAIAAVVADSPWADQQFQIARMSTIPVGPLSVPALPYEPALVDALIGTPLEAARPLAVIGRISPRAVLLIRSADDTNATTPLSAERALFAAAGDPKAEWIAPSGGHAGALNAHPADYQRQVLSFLAAYLGVPPAA